MNLRSSVMGLLLGWHLEVNLKPDLWSIVWIL